jgi:hypothetical protein
MSAHCLTLNLTEKSLDRKSGLGYIINGGLYPVRLAGPVALFIGYDASFFYFA